MNRATSSVAGLRGDRQRVGDLLDPRLVHDDDAVGHRQRLFLVVRDVDEHQPELTLEVAELDAHAELQQPVEVAERLVEEQRLRLRHEHAGERDALLLAARERAGLRSESSERPTISSASIARFRRSALPSALHLQPEGDVVEHGAVREEREVLEDGRRRPLVRRQVDERLAVEDDVALGRVLVAADHPQRRRLAAARRAEQDDVLPVVDVQVDVVDGERCRRGRPS